MLPAPARVRSRSEHRLVAARGRRSRRGPLVVHLVDGATLPPRTSSSDDLASSVSTIAPPAGPARAGVVVGKRVGPAVRRNLVKRRLREHLRTRLPQLRDGSLLVVRALPGAAEADYGRLGSSLDAALRALDAMPAAAAPMASPPAGGAR